MNLWTRRIIMSLLFLAISSASVAIAQTTSQIEQAKTDVRTLVEQFLSAKKEPATAQALHLYATEAQIQKLMADKQMPVNTYRPLYAFPSGMWLMAFRAMPDGKMTAVVDIHNDLSAEERSRKTETGIKFLVFDPKTGQIIQVLN